MNNTLETLRKLDTEKKEAGFFEKKKKKKTGGAGCRLLYKVKKKKKFTEANLHKGKRKQMIIQKY